MRRIVEKVADLLTYSGPSMADLIKKALEEGNDFKVEQTGELKILKVKFQLPYGIEATDKYFYNSESHLIKQTLCVRNKEKIIFDKYNEAAKLLSKLDQQSILVS